jgi:hypothetical protein
MPRLVKVQKVIVSDAPYEEVEINADEVLSIERDAASGQTTSTGIPFPPDLCKIKLTKGEVHERVVGTVEELKHRLGLS